MAAAPAADIFDVIRQGDLAEVQRRVETDPGVMEERGGWDGQTPLMWAIMRKQSAIALWLLHHGSDHDLDTEDDIGLRVIHRACQHGPLEIVQQLVAAGADALAATDGRITPLILAASRGHANIVAFLLCVPGVRTRIDTMDVDNGTALSLACDHGHAPVVQLLLDAGANPTIPQGDDSPLSRATSHNRHAVILLLTAAIAKPQRPHALFRARTCSDAAHAVRKAHAITNSPHEARAKALAAMPACLRGRVEKGEALPIVALTGRGSEKEQAVLAYVLSMAEEDEEEEGGYGGAKRRLPREVLAELMELMVPRWDQAGVRRP